ncbi:FkbM family methyltransferase [Mucilaginibacter ginsenosidivorans]|uniref:FkbM family methyltransferase n=1 Tax=Mucilaginibacter ginsenosidivorans TaxID=398053 RepID=A0A5B8V2F4_9SPHI|nr:FkbM family methyltransferase [Mucilaginibacter ginsenosidivorans]QEC65544.1 FkbM family methyltransferase [Mucilaginibacter ginsenosidivorans]
MLNLAKRLLNKIKRTYASRKEWDARINDVINCADNKYIPRVKNAGAIQGNFQLMHNGVKVQRDGYYGSGITRMLVKNKGVHEPQEERVFQEVLKQMRANSTMIELGSYWAFYSMWFLSKVEGGKTYLYEPATENLTVGKINYRENNFQGDFNHAFIGGVVDHNGVPTLSVDYIVKDKKIDFIDILHCDIQGAELDMLNGAIESVSKDIIGYFFISTHSDELHVACLDFLGAHNYFIVCEADLSNSYSYDGIIVARSPNYAGINRIAIARK